MHYLANEYGEKDIHLKGYGPETPALIEREEIRI